MAGSGGVGPVLAPPWRDLARVVAGERTMRRVRLAAAGFAALQFALYRPSIPGLVLPFPRLPTALGIVATLLGTDAVSLVATRRWAGRPRALFRLGLAELAADTAVVAAVIVLFAFDPLSAIWALAVLPPIEAAARAGPGGAMAVCAICAGVVASTVAFGRALFPTALAFAPASLTYRAGVVVLVALAATLLSRETTRQALAAERRAQLLQAVAEAAAAASPDVDATLGAAVAALHRLGFAVANVCTFDDATRRFRVVHACGFPPGYDGSVHPASAGLPGLVVARRATVVLEDYQALPSAIPLVAASGVRSAIGVPVWVDGELVGALCGGELRRRRFSKEEVEAVELLAAQAGTSLLLARRASRDPLTGLPNRAELLRRHEALPARGHGGAVVLADLDGFAAINDTLGQRVGDELLAAVARRLRAWVRERELVARYGGDEFAIVLAGADEARALEVASRLVEALHEPYHVGGATLYVGASVGVARVAEGEGGLAEALRQAELALSKARTGGPKRVAVFSPDMAEHARDKLAIATDLHQAISGGELFLVYEPVVELATGHVRALEALVRWRHPHLGVLEPDRFVPVAEESGLIVELGRAVLEQACGALRAGLGTTAGRAVARLSVNVSGHELRRPGYATEVLRVLARAGVAPDQLVLEVTETVAVQATEALVALSELAEAGVGVVLDDFGKGASSLSALTSLPLSGVKLDRAFVERVAQEPRDRAVAASLVGLGRALGLEVVAEGIETEAQLEAMLALGCELGQGYLFGRPTPRLDAAVGHLARPRRETRRRPSLLAAPERQAKPAPGAASGFS